MKLTLLISKLNNFFIGKLTYIKYYTKNCDLQLKIIVEVET